MAVSVLLVDPGRAAECLGHCQIKRTTTLSSKVGSCFAEKKTLRGWLRQQKTEIPAMNGSAINDDKLILWGMKATP